MLRFSIEGASQIGEGVWRAQLDPSQVRKLGPCSNLHGKLSVILVTAAPGGDDDNLELEPDCTHVLNIGTSSETVFIVEPESEAAMAASERSPGPIARAPGDQAFLEDLQQLALIGKIPDGLRVLGEQLLEGVRRESPGGLDHFPRSGKYVESEDNFWSVKIQPDAKSLRLTVRGDPEHFRSPTGIELKPDMPRYSNFVISRSEQIPGALSVIRQARRKGSKRRHFGA